MLLHDRNENAFGPKQLDWLSCNEQTYPIAATEPDSEAAGI
jgi:hypothetical protein